MTSSEQKIVQYLNEAHASEVALVRVLQSQIAMTPRGNYRTALERHLRETRGHAERVEARLGELGGGGNPIQAVGGVAQAIVGQALALAKTPFDIVRGTGGEEKVLKNAKDACATEALEIATYAALERLARSVGDDATAQLARSIRADEEKMLARVLEEIPKLTEAVADAELRGDPSYDAAKTGAADAARRTATKAKRTAGRARSKAPGTAPRASDLPIAGYDKLSADEVTARLPALSQSELGKVAAYERRHANRSTILGRIDALRGDEPWPGYDELIASDVESAVAKLDDGRREAVRAYERAHKNRTSVIRATEREPATA